MEAALDSESEIGDSSSSTVAWAERYVMSSEKEESSGRCPKEKSLVMVGQL